MISRVLGSCRRVLVVMSTALCVLAGGLVLVSPATARTAHTFYSSFTGSGASALSEPVDVAVNDLTGDVYVLDRGNNRVEEFDSTGSTMLAEFDGSVAPTGAFVSPDAIAVDNSANPLDPSAGDVYVADTGHNAIDKFEADGAYIGQITLAENGISIEGPIGIDVDSNGELWAYQSNSQIYSYSDAMINSFLAGHTSPFGANPGFAVDAVDNLYVNKGNEVLGKITPNGENLSAAIDEERATAAAVDLSGNNVYLDNVGTIAVFDESGALLERFGTGRLSEGAGLAIDSGTGPASDRVYVADRAGNDVAIFDFGGVPDLTVEPVSVFTGSTSTKLKGTVNPGNTTVTACEFEYGPEPGVLVHKAGCVPGSPLTGDLPVTVEADASGLTPGQANYYRLAAKNATGTETSAEASVFVPTPVSIVGESDSFIETTATRLEAQINPGGVDASYRFEYGTVAGSYEVSVPVAGGHVGATASDVSVSAVAKNLTPGTTYHFRIVATNELPGAVDGPDRTFTTAPVEGTGSPPGCVNEKARSEQPYGLDLPDCRAYEIVSPLDKDDNNVANAGARAAISGEAVTYLSKGAFAGAQSAMFANRYISRRGAEGWETQSLTPPYHAFTGNLSAPYDESVFTPDLSAGILKSEDTPLTVGEPAGYVNLYVGDTASGSYEAVSTVTPPSSEVEPYEGLPNEPRFAGASTDLRSVAFQEYAALTPGASPRHSHVYEWQGSGLSSVDVPPPGVSFEAEDSIGAPGVFNEPANGDPWHAVSSDGSKIIFTAGEVTGPIGVQEPNGQLYVREVPQAKTIEVSASQRTVADPNGPQPARYWDASVDGSKIFFTSRAELTDDANTGAADDAPNLYEYDLSTGALTDMTVDIDVADSHGAAVLGLVTAGDDGSYVYFVAEGDLVGAAVSGRPNLYVYHAGRVTFIATLAPATTRSEDAKEGGGDSADWYGAQPLPGQNPGVSAGPSSHTVRVTSDGTRLAFESEESLTGFDNRPAQPEDCESGKCREIYLYDTESEALACVSCDPNGLKPTGPAEFGGTTEAGAETVSGSSSFHKPNNLSDDGSRLFFESPDPLVTHDSNGLGDVYEYEDGHVHPISDVASDRASVFLDASASGNDVFIATGEKLLSSDTDTRTDVYDARVGGGFPVTLSPPACDNGDSCKPPVSPQPAVFSAPASATFSGAGNVAPLTAKPAVKVKVKVKRCRKGFVKKHGKCVRRKRTSSSARAKKGRK